MTIDEAMEIAQRYSTPSNISMAILVLSEEVTRLREYDAEVYRSAMQSVVDTECKTWQQRAETAEAERNKFQVRIAELKNTRDDAFKCMDVWMAKCKSVEESISSTNPAWEIFRLTNDLDSAQQAEKSNLKYWKEWAARAERYRLVLERISHMTGHPGNLAREALKEPENE